MKGTGLLGLLGLSKSSEYQAYCQNCGIELKQGALLYHSSGRVFCPDRREKDNGSCLREVSRGGLEKEGEIPILLSSKQLQRGIGDKTIKYHSLLVKKKF